MFEELVGSFDALRAVVRELGKVSFRRIPGPCVVSGRMSFPPVHGRTFVGVKRGTVSRGPGTEVGSALVQQARA
jgi:hypothetical protein